MKNGTVFVILILIAVSVLVAFLVPVAPTTYPKSENGCNPRGIEGECTPLSVEGSITYILFGCGGITLPDQSYHICPAPGVPFQK
jgi:hypothetical protein